MQVMDMLINLIMESFHSVYVYQIIRFYTLNILQFICQLYHNKSAANNFQSLPHLSYYFNNYFLAITYLLL